MQLFKWLPVNKFPLFVNYPPNSSSLKGPLFTKGINRPFNCGTLQGRLSPII